MKRTDRRALWKVPVLLALVTAAGLSSALLGDGPWDVLSWILLAVPVAVCAWFGVARRPARSRPLRTSDPSGSRDPH